MPDIDDIERRLRLLALDEPMFLPALELPWGAASRVMRTPIRAGRSSAGTGLMPSRLVVVALLHGRGARCHPHGRAAAGSTTQPARPAATVSRAVA